MAHSPQPGLSPVCLGCGSQMWPVVMRGSRHNLSIRRSGGQPQKCNSPERRGLAWVLHRNTAPDTDSRKPWRRPVLCLRPLGPEPLPLPALFPPTPPESPLTQCWCSQLRQTPTAGQGAEPRVDPKLYPLCCTGSDPRPLLSWTGPNTSPQVLQSQTT